MMELSEPVHIWYVNNEASLLQNTVVCFGKSLRCPHIDPVVGRNINGQDPVSQRRQLQIQSDDREGPRAATESENRRVYDVDANERQLFDRADWLSDEP